MLEKEAHDETRDFSSLTFFFCPAIEMLDPERIAELHPLVDVANVECGLWTPHDGYVDPTMLTNAVAKEVGAAACEYAWVVCVCVCVCVCGA